jgi:hypothetical protein
MPIGQLSLRLLAPHSKKWNPYLYVIDDADPFRSSRSKAQNLSRPWKPFPDAKTNNKPAISLHCYLPNSARPAQILPHTTPSAPPLYYTPRLAFICTAIRQIPHGLRKLFHVAISANATWQPFSLGLYLHCYSSISAHAAQICSLGRIAIPRTRLRASVRGFSSAFVFFVSSCLRV